MGKKKAKKVDTRTRDIIARARAAVRSGRKEDAVDRMKAGKQVGLKEYVEATEKRTKAKEVRQSKRPPTRATMKTRVAAANKIVTNMNDFPITPVNANDPRVAGDIELDRSGNVVPTVVPDRLPEGEAVYVTWPGTSDGTNRRRGLLDGYTKDGKPQVLLARVNQRGEYTGEIAAKPRTFERYEVFSIATDCNSQRGVWETIRSGESAAMYDERIARGPTEAERASTETLAGTPADVRDHGAKGDAAANDTAAIQAAIDAVDIKSPGAEATPDVVELVIAKEIAPPPPDDVPWGNMQPNVAPVPAPPDVPHPKDPRAVSKRRTKSAAGCVPHTICGRLPEVMKTKDIGVLAWCPECKTTGVQLATRDLAVAEWNRMNGAPVEPVVRIVEVPMDLAPGNLPRPVMVIDQDGEHLARPVSTQTKAAASVPPGTQPANRPATDAELLGAMGNPHAPPATAAEAKARLNHTVATIGRAIDRANTNERTVARAAQVDATTASCSKCGSAMILTRAGNQRVCARCDYFEKKQPDGSWIGLIEVKEPTGDEVVEVVMHMPSAAPFEHRLPADRMDVAEREYDRAHGPFATFKELRAAMTQSTPAPVEAPQDPPPAADGFIPPMADDDLPADEGKMPWE